MTTEFHGCVPAADTVPPRRQRELGLTATCEDCGARLVWTVARRGGLTIRGWRRQDAE